MTSLPDIINEIEMECCVRTRRHGHNGAIYARNSDRFRFLLWRQWNCDQRLLGVIGLNPSTATESEDDPTIRRCIGFAKQGGYGGLVMMNLFGLRSTDPDLLKTVRDPVGSLNHEIVSLAAFHLPTIVAAWGNHGLLDDADLALCACYLDFENDRQLRDVLMCWGTNKNGSPKHPLYLPKAAKLQPYIPRNERAKRV